MNKLEGKTALMIHTNRKFVVWAVEKLYLSTLAQAPELCQTPEHDKPASRRSAASAPRRLQSSEADKAR